MLTTLKEYLCFGLGVDFGGEYSKASMLLPGRYFVMIEDSISKTKTPTSLSFCQTTRFFEHQSLKKFAKQKCDNFRYLNRYFNDKNDQHDQNYTQQSHLFRDTHDKSNDEYGTLFSMNSNNLPPLEQITQDQEYKIRLEELQGMLLKNLKSNTERTTDVQFKNVVYTIPDNNVSIQQRKRIASSIIMAGMTPTAFVSENTAATVFYALNNHSLKPDINENILLINIGTLGVKINVMNIENMKEDPAKEDSIIYPKVTKIYDKFFSSFNGNQLDNCFMNYTLNKHHQKQNENLLNEIDHTRFFKLFDVCRKPKEILSINKSYQVKLDNFFDNLPLSAKVVKEEYEQSCQQNFENLKEIFQKVKNEFLEKNIKFDKLEVIGGVVRMPKIRDLIQTEFEQTAASHINGDDGPCQGAALMAANYSAGVKTKKIELSESPNYHIEYEIKSINKNFIERQNLFDLGTPYGSKKMMKFDNLKEDLDIDIFVPEQDYHMNIKVNGTEGLEDKMKDKNITDWTGVLNFELDLLGIPKLSLGMVYINETITEKFNTTKRILKNSTEEKNETEILQDDQILKNQTESLDTNSTIQQDNNSTDIKNNTNKTKAPEYEYIQVEEERQRTKTHKIKLYMTKTENISYLLQNKEEFDKSKKFLNDIEKFEEERRRLLQKKNELESFVFKLKDFATNEETNIFLNDQEKDDFLKRSEEVDDYMFSDDIDNATFQNITDKINDINVMIKPFKTRQQEYLNRDLMFNVTMQRFSNQTQAIQKIHKRKSWISEDQIKEVNAYLYEVRQNVTDLYKQQKEVPMHEDPIFFNITVVQDYDQKLDSKIKDLRRIAKPKNETDTQKKPNMEEMLKNMDPSKLNMTTEQMQEMLEKMKTNFNLDEMQENIKKMEENLKNLNQETTTTDEQPQQTKEENTEIPDEETIQKEEEIKLEEDIIEDM